MKKKIFGLLSCVAVSFSVSTVNAWDANDFNTIVGGNKAVTGSNLKPSQVRSQTKVVDREVTRLMIDLGLSGGKFIAFAGENPADPVVQKKKAIYKTKLKSKRTQTNARLQFANASYELDNVAINKVEALARTYQIAKGQIKQISINGFTNSIGSDKSNQLLSHNRAASVRSALIQRGVPSNLLRFHGYGETRPMRGTDPAAASNRRVEYEVIKK